MTANNSLLHTYALKDARSLKAVQSKTTERFAIALSTNAAASFSASLLLTRPNKFVLLFGFFRIPIVIRTWNPSNNSKLVVKDTP